MTLTTVSSQAETARVAAVSAFAPPLDRGGTAANGKPSYTVDAAAAQILRDGYSLNGTGVTGTSATVTYAYRATTGVMPGDTAGFSQFSTAQINATQQALAAWSDVANIVFVRVTDHGSAYSDNATLLLGNYASGNAGAAAFTYYPGSTDAASSDDDIWINASLGYEATPQLYGYGDLTLVHEIGHAIGLGEAEYLDPGYGSPTYAVNAGYFEDSQQYTVMSDWAAANTGASYLGRYAAAPMVDDIAAAQALYGANMATRAGDTVYGFNSNAGRAYFSATTAAAPLIFAVWDAGGTDTFDFSGYSQDAFIDLRATHFSSVGGMTGNVAIAQGVTIENAIGGSGNDTFVGNAANNVFTGGGGTDTVDYGAEAAQVMVSLVTGSATGTTIGTDTLNGIENVSGGSGVDGLTGDDHGNRLFGNGSADVLRGQGGNDYLDGGAGADIMYGGAGNDSYVVDATTDRVSEQANVGVDDGGIDTVMSSVSFQIGQFFENLTLTGTGNINGAGNAADNVIIGNAGANRLTGGDGNDTLNGGDAYLGTIVDTGGAFHGTLATAMAVSPSSFSLAASLNIENATTVAHATVQGSGDGTYRVYAITINNAGAVGSFDIDQTVGMDSFLRLYDGNGNLLASDDDSLLAQGGGGSTSAGDSYINYVFAAAGTYYVEVSEYSHDVISAGDSYILNLSLGNNGATIGGNDILDGGSGADAMTGGLGNDTYSVDNAGDTATEGVNEGVDLVMSSVSFILGANVDNLTLTGTGNLNGTGNDIANILVGTSGANVLTGGGGNDIIMPGAGNDVADGGGGIDTIDYAADTAGVTVSLSNGTATGSGIGTDTVANFENANGGSGGDALGGTDVANSLSGGAGNDILTARGGNDMLNGGTGADAMNGGAGDDTYYVDNAGDTASEALPGGADAGGVDLVFAAASWTLGSFFENLTLTGAGNVSGTGNGQDNRINGNSGANVLNGMGGNDTIVAGAGSDHIDGGAGNDIMMGGDGDDTYYVDSAGDRISEQTVAGIDDGGWDTVYSAVSFLLSDFIENLTLTGTANINAAGNSESNSLFGNGGNNTISGLDGWDSLHGGGGNDTLIGGTGQDTMYGGAGSDTYYVDDTNDLVSEQTVAGHDDGGNDIIYATATFTMSAYVETLTMTGLGSIDATGGAQANTINGNAGNNVIKGMDGDDVLFGNGGNDTLDGGAGADRMWGGAGNDTYVVDSAADVVSETRAAGVDDGGADTVQTSLSYVLGAFIENLTLTGIAQVNGVGNALANVLIGNGSTNLLNGMAGNDTLTGGGGADLFQFSTGSGADIITDFSLTQNDKINLHAYAGVSHSVTQVNSDVVIDFGGGNSVTVQNATLNDAFLAHVIF